MRAVVFDQPGDESVLHVEEVPSPQMKANEVRIAVQSTAVNRADLLQRRGLYPPPPGASTILGMECAGTIWEVGSEVTGWSAGDRVMALLPGGGYAEEATVDAGSVMRVPDARSLDEAGAIPETFLTVFLNVFMIGAVKAGDRILVHGGGSGIGTSAIALCREADIEIAVTAGSDEKCSRCLALGASVAINYKRESFVERVAQWTGDSGVNLILDSIGGSYLGPNIESLGNDGRLVVIGGMGGRSGELNLGAVLSRRLHIIGSTLRGRSAGEKRRITDGFVTRFGPALEEGRIAPVIDSIFPLEQAAAAHRLVQSSGHFGKVVIKVR